MVGCASNVPHLLSTCCGLLLVPSHILPVYMQCLEKILRELALYSPENGTIAIRMLLNNKPGIIEPLQMQTAQDRHLVNSSSDFSTCELLYQICEHQVQNPYFHHLRLIKFKYLFYRTPTRTIAYVWYWNGFS